MTKEELDKISLDYIPNNSCRIGSHSREKDVEQFLNGVKGLTNLQNNTSGTLYGYSGYGCLVGKTIDAIFESPKSTDGNYIIYCFTDNTFAIRYTFKTDLDSTVLSTTAPLEMTTYINEPYGDMLVFRGILDYSNREEIVKILPFGRWLMEHTDVDVLGYYNKVVKDKEEDDERMKQYHYEQDLKQYNYLKEKLGL